MEMKPHRLHIEFHMVTVPLQSLRSIIRYAVEYGNTKWKKSKFNISHRIYTYLYYKDVYAIGVLHGLTF